LGRAFSSKVTPPGPGACAGAGAAIPAAPCIIKVLSPKVLGFVKTLYAREVTRKMAARTPVIRTRRPPAPVLPKTEPLPPPKITPMPSCPDCKSTKSTRKTHVKIWIVRTRVCNSISSRDACASLS